MSLFEFSPPPILNFDLEEKISIPNSKTSTPNSPIIFSSRDFHDNIHEMDGTPTSVQVPTHPIPEMQGAFAESYLESKNSANSDIVDRPKTALARRKQLLEQKSTEPTNAARWRLKLGQEHHTLWKIMSQISFGVYLLLNEIARDEEKVLKILQVHVDEVDEFLESTLEDFCLAQHDIEDRLENLKLPLRNIILFENMMEDRSFRLQIVEGNEKIEHVILRTAAAMNDALKEIQQGTNACMKFSAYIESRPDYCMWKDKEAPQRIYKAMKGNVEGWCKAFTSLKEKVSELDAALVQLGSIIAELARRAGEVSRKNRFSAIVPPARGHSSIMESRISRQMRLSLMKGLQSFSITPDSTDDSNSHQDSNHNHNIQGIPEMDSEIMENQTAELQSDPEFKPESEPELILKPQTYSPFPSPRPFCASIYSESGPAEAMSLERSPPRLNSAHEAPPHLSLQGHLSIPLIESCQLNEELNDLNDWQAPCRTENIKSPFSRLSSETTTNNSLTSSSSGPDSASYSDCDKNLPRIFSPILKLNMSHDLLESPITSQSNNSQDSLDSCQSNESQYSHYSNDSRPVSKSNQKDQKCNSSTSSRNNSLSTLGANFSTHEVPKDTNRTNSNLLAPVSINILEKQNLRPVKASPHSPLQQNWTASLSQNPLHIHQNSSSSNLSSYSSYCRPNGNPKMHSQQYAKHLSHLRPAPSICSKSVKSEMIPGHRKKEKKGFFGWLKDQFSLSEEEKMRFQEKINIGEKPSSYSVRNMERGSRSERQIWLDGKRVGERKTA